MARFGNNVRTFRLAAGLTQKQLAERVGCSEAHISYIEREQRGVGDDLKFALCDALNAPFQKLFYLDHAS